MIHQNLTFMYPGDLNTRTGGYRYDKRIVESLQQGTGNTTTWNVTPVSLEGDFPFPSASQLATASAQFDAIDDNTLTVVDGLAYSVMPELMARQASRLVIVALIHHPLALETGLAPAQAAQLKALETHALQYASHVITTSELTASSLAQYKVPPDKVDAVLPGTDGAQIAIGSSSDTPNLLCVATLTRRKGHCVLLDALAAIDHLPWHLHCVGSTDRDISNYHALLEQTKHHALSDRVSFVGELEDEELDRYYHQADVFVLASFHEGYGMVLSEAIARGLPIVCSDAGAMPHTVPNGAGLLVPPGDHQALADALRHYLTDQQLKAQLKHHAVEARQHLRSWQTAANEFSQILTMTQREHLPRRNV